MSAYDLKVRMSDVPGIQSLKLELKAGRIFLTWGNGYAAAVDATASNQEIENAIRSAIRLPPITLIPEKPAVLAPVAPATTIGTVMSVTGAKFAGLNLKSELQAIRQSMEQNAQAMSDAVAEMKDAATQHGALAQTIKAEAAELKAAMSEFTNGAPTDASSTGT